MQNEDTKKNYQLLINHNYFYVLILLCKLKCNFDKNDIQCLSINRKTSKISVLNVQQYKKLKCNPPKQQFIIKFQLLIGIILISSQPYLLICRQSRKVATFIYHPIYCITQVKFIKFDDNSVKKNIQMLLDGIRNQVINEYMYYSLKQTLTLRQQKIYSQQKIKVDNKFYWNYNMLAILRSIKSIAQCWMIPIMQGYIQQINFHNKYFNLNYLSISRRSKYMSGTRFTSRGLDTDGNAANFVQTQQIIKCHDLVFAYVSLRGSVPIFWQQSNVGSKIYFGTAKNFDHEIIISKHYNNLKNDYQAEIITINLLSSDKSPQKQLNNRFQFYFDRCIKSPYLYFNIKKQLKDHINGQIKISNFIEKQAYTITNTNNFFCINPIKGQIKSYQIKVARVNCLDCIDRTNVIMSRLSELYWLNIQNYINSANITEKKLIIGIDIKQAITKKWVQLGNAISIIYCGTNSVASHLVKKQNYSIKSFVTSSFKSFNRYYNANHNDNHKQICQDYLLATQASILQIPYFQKNLQLEVKSEVYSDYSCIEVVFLTWNVNTLKPRLLTLQDKKLLFIKNYPIYFICLQEVRQLNSKNVVLYSNNDIINDWIEVILSQLNEKNKNYYCCSSYNFVGLAIFCFVLKDLQHRVTELSWLQVKTGFKNTMGNKGGIALLLKIDQTLISIVNCHLKAGQNKFSQRYDNLQHILEQVYQEDDKSKLFKKSEFRIILGDMNFRLHVNKVQDSKLFQKIQSYKQNASDQEKCQAIKNELMSLQKYDQLKLNYYQQLLNGYSQGCIQFIPTYKLIHKTSQYNSMRIPAWCDRIMYYSLQKDRIALQSYHDINCYQSDHKPVQAVIAFKVKSKNMKKYDQYITSYLFQK